MKRKSKTFLVVDPPEDSPADKSAGSSRRSVRESEERRRSKSPSCRSKSSGGKRSKP